MIKIYEDIKEFIEVDVDLEYKFSKDCYVLKVYDSDYELIVQKSKDYSQGLVIKESYHVDSARSFHVVNLDGVAALIGRINEDITVIKKFDSSEVGKMQVRRDAENVYIVKVGYFKSLIDANNMGVLIEL